MRGRIIDIAGTPRHIAIERGFITISDKEAELGRIDLDGVAGIMITSLGASLTTRLLSTCGARQIPVITCDHHYQPSVICTPVIQHSDQTRRFILQTQAKKGLKNSLWQALVKAKIRNQAAVLSFFDGKEIARLERLARDVRAGDKENKEAQAAQVYWPDLFGRSYRRSDETNTINGLLNYGYAILRTTMVRAVLLVGLNPALGLHHHNRHNPFCLVDDLMEPYRPLVDQLVRRLVDLEMTALTDQTKQMLAGLVTADMPHKGQLSPVFQDMYQCVWSLMEVLEGQARGLSLPGILNELELESTIRPILNKC